MYCPFVYCFIQPLLSTAGRLFCISEEHLGAWWVAKTMRRGSLTSPHSGQLAWRLKSKSFVSVCLV